MIKGTDSHSGRFLRDLAAIDNRIERAQREIASGRRINAPSDSPDEISTLLGLRSGLGAAEQAKSNLGRVKTEVDAAEQSLNHATKLLDRIQVLGAQGATDIADANARLTLAGEVEQILGDLVNVANTEIAGRFIFAGDTDQTPPYQFDPTQPQPVSAFGGSTTTRQIGHPGGGRFPISKAGNTIFEGPTAANNLFQSITDLRNALAADDTATVRASLANVRSASQYFNVQLAFYGGAQNQIDEALQTAESQIVRFKSQISSIEDADLTASILELNQNTQVREAALAAESRRPRNSLFDYLR
jgi:flagellar hook-associated protein 3 FlgL